MPGAEQGTVPVPHGYAFDPTGGYSPEALLAVAPPPAPEGFADFWQCRFARAATVAPRPALRDSGQRIDRWRVMDLTYTSTDRQSLAGWALVPVSGEIRRGFIVGHGYSGREGPDALLPFEDAVIFFPCTRGLGRSAHPDLPSDPQRHVVVGIDDPDTYLLGGCVDDLWLGVSALLELFPEVAGAVHLLGISFSGGLAMLAAPWDPRLARVHLNVPTFGHQRLRLELPTVGSGAAVQAYVRRHPGRADRTLALFDAASAARHLGIPAHCACACFDPAVTPAGQFAIHNALPEALRSLFVLTAGHHPYPAEAAESGKLLQELRDFFAS